MKNVFQSKLFSIEYGVGTHIGQRSLNQDEVLAVLPPSALNGGQAIFAVADGMGGHPGGETASRMACGQLQDYFITIQGNFGGQGPVDIRDRLVEAFIRIDRSLRRHGLDDPALEDMGTTLSCLVITNGRSIIVHVGDSRIYRLRKGRLSCLTEDHTFVREMIFEGVVDPAHAHSHPLRHMLTRAVGTAEPLEKADTRIDNLKADDCFLVCSDGLYNAVSRTTIQATLARESPPSDLAAELVARALQSGARDNVTGVVVKLKPL